MRRLTAVIFRLVVDAEMDDGMLDVSIFSAPPGIPPVQSAIFLRQVAAVAMGRPETETDLRFFRSYRLRIEAASPTAVQVDGDGLWLYPAGNRGHSQISCRPDSPTPAASLREQLDGVYEPHE